MRRRRGERSIGNTARKAQQNLILVFSSQRRCQQIPHHRFRFRFRFRFRSRRRLYYERCFVGRRREKDAAHSKKGGLTTDYYSLPTPSFLKNDKGIQKAKKMKKSSTFSLSLSLSLSLVVPLAFSRLKKSKTPKEIACA